MPYNAAFASSDRLNFSGLDGDLKQLTVFPAYIELIGRLLTLPKYLFIAHIFLTNKEMVRPGQVRSTEFT